MIAGTRRYIEAVNRAAARDFTVTRDHLVLLRHVYLYRDYGDGDGALDRLEEALREPRARQRAWPGYGGHPCRLWDASARRLAPPHIGASGGCGSSGIGGGCGSPNAASAADMAP